MLYPNSANRIGLIFGNAFQQEGIDRLFAGSYLVPNRAGRRTFWQIGEIEIFAEVGGMTVASCRDAAERLISDSVDGVISAGFAFDMTGKQNVGDIVIAANVSDEAGSNLVYSSRYLRPYFFSSSMEYNVKSSGITSCASSESYTGNADIVDTESYKAAKLCEKNEVPFISVRAIIDRSFSLMRKDAYELLGMQNKYKKRLFAASHPKAFAEVLYLKRSLDSAVYNLADIISLIVLKLLREKK